MPSTISETVAPGGVDLERAGDVERLQHDLDLRRLAGLDRDRLVLAHEAGRRIDRDVVRARRDAADARRQLVGARLAVEPPGHDARRVDVEIEAGVLIADRRRRCAGVRVAFAAPAFVVFLPRHRDDDDDGDDRDRRATDRDASACRLPCFAGLRPSMP